MPITIGSGIPWTLSSPPRYIFRRASLIDPVEGVVHRNVTVSTYNGLIELVEYGYEKETGGSPLIVDSKEEDSHPIEVDLQGKYICPGLIDCHVHLNAVPGEATLGQMKKLSTEVVSLRQPHLCRLMIERGFTTARDCGGSGIALKDAIKQGVVSGPRLFIAINQLTQTGGHGDTRDSYDTTPCCGGHVFGSGRLCDGVPECLRVVRDQLRRGADFIKIMGGGGISSPTDGITMVQFTPEEIRAFVSVAERSDTYVTCHAYTPASIMNAIENGVRGIEHGNFIDPPTAKKMAEMGVFLTPTLATYSAMATEPFTKFLPKEAISKNEEVLKVGMDSLRIADEANVTMCFGTDLLGAMTQFETSEFEVRSQALSPTKILQSATINAAKMLRQPAFLGQIKPGFAADLLILNANPLENIKIFDAPEQHLLAVLKDGRVEVSRWSNLREDIGRPLASIE
jgi:imidazolonepropionase-like amidohydrolase